MKFGDINPTRFGFGSSQDQDEPKKPCFCNLSFNIEVTILENWMSEKNKRPFTYYLAVNKNVACEHDVQPRDEYDATYTEKKGGFHPTPGVLRVRWTRTKMCGECFKKPCQEVSKLCGESGYYTGGITTNYKRLWKLRSTLDQDETKVKQILNDMAKRKKCKYDKACKQTEKVCGGDFGGN